MCDLTRALRFCSESYFSSIKDPENRQFINYFISQRFERKMLGINRKPIAFLFFHLISQEDDVLHISHQRLFPSK